MSEHYRQSTDPITPNLRLCIEDDGVLLKIYEADMTSAAPTAQIVNLHDKIILMPEEARWLRDTLNTMDIEEGERDSRVPIVHAIREMAKRFRAHAEENRALRVQYIRSQIAGRRGDEHKYEARAELYDREAEALEKLLPKE